MARATGVEITETEVRVVELDGTDKKYKLLGAAAVPIEADDDGGRSPEQVGTAARAAFRATKAKKEQIVLGLPAHEAVIREIVIPFTDKDQIRKVIKFESESHLPSSNIDEVIVGFYKVSETGPRSRILIFAVEKTALKKRLAILSKAGIEPTQVDLGATALYSMTRLIPDLACDDPDDTGVNVILDLGEFTTTVVVTEGETLRMIRSMRIGTETLARTLSTDLGIAPDEARSVAQSLEDGDAPFATAGDVESREPSTALTADELKTDIIRDKQSDFARRIINEIRRTLSSVHVEGRVQGMWLTGPASGTAGLESQLHEAFGVAIKPLDVLSGGEHRGDTSAGSFAGPAIGLALKALEHDPVGLEFRQEEFAYARKFDRVRNPLLFASALILVLLAFLSIIEMKRIKSVEKDVEFIADQTKYEYDKQIVTSASAHVGYYDYATPKEAEHISEKLGSGEPIKRINLATRELNDIATHLSNHYGIDPRGGLGEDAPENIATSALVRLEAWVSVLNRLREEKKVIYKIDKLDVSDTKVQWTMRLPRSSVTIARDFLNLELPKLDGVSDYKGGDTKSLGEQSEITSSTLNFERGY
ncbi:MAG: pilus assembly protein PilM [Planctomycetota bacterium]|nr:pilus assembly protein PilM [Planctomycetota bacterium]